MLKYTNTTKTAAQFNGAFFSLASPDAWDSIGDGPTREAVLKWLAAGNVPLPADPAPNPRIAEIKTRLDQIDIESIRALRAKSVGKGKAADDTKLTSLDTEADALRAELAVTAAFVSGK